MHYRPLSFNKNDSIPTITTTIPYFNDVIGQRLDFSAVDITRVNRMYDCGEYYPSARVCWESQWSWVEFECSSSGGRIELNLTLNFVEEECTLQASLIRGFLFLFFQPTRSRYWTSAPSSWSTFAEWSRTRTTPQTGSRRWAVQPRPTTPSSDAAEVLSYDNIWHWHWCNKWMSDKKWITGKTK